jgi:hypothetical protein
MAELDLYSLSVHGTLNGNDVVNVWGFLQKSTLNGFQGQLLIDEFQAGVFNAYRGIISNFVTFNFLRCRSLPPDPIQLAEEALPGGTLGLAAGDPEPNQVAQIVTWRTSLAGRAYRGRTYVPGLPDGAVSAGLITSGHLSGVTTFVNTMLSTFGPAGSSTNFQLVIISRWLNKVERPTPVGTPVTVGVPRNIPGTVRRRRIGVGS